MSPAVEDEFPGPARCEEREVFDPVAAELDLRRGCPPAMVTENVKQRRCESGSMQTRNLGKCIVRKLAEVKLKGAQLR